MTVTIFFFFFLTNPIRSFDFTVDPLSKQLAWCYRFVLI